MWWVAIASASCPADPAAAIRAWSRALDEAFDAVEEQTFALAYAGLHADAACVREPLDAETVLAWHRARALGEFFEREEIASAKSWAAVRVLDPAWSPPDGWIVEGTALHRAWTGAPMTPGRIRLERSPAGGWHVDGSPSETVPADRAFVLQGFDAAGAVVHTDYHYSVAEVPVVDFEALDATARERRRRRMRVAGTALGSALVAGAASAGVLGWTQERATKADDTRLADVSGHAQRANTWSTVALGLAGGGAAVATVAWSVRW